MARQSSASHAILLGMAEHLAALRSLIARAEYPGQAESGKEAQLPPSALLEEQMRPAPTQPHPAVLQVLPAWTLLHHSPAAPLGPLRAPALSHEGST